MIKQTKRLAALGLGLITLLGTSSIGMAQSAADFKKTWGVSYGEQTHDYSPSSPASEDASDWIYRIRKVSDGNYLAAGFTTERNWTYGQVRTPSMIKLDQHGNKIWSTRYLDPVSDDNTLGGEFWDVIEVDGSPGEYVAAGIKAKAGTHTCTTKFQRPYIVRTDEDGNTIGSPFYASDLSEASSYAIDRIIQVSSSDPDVDKFIIVGQKVLHNTSCGVTSAPAVLIELEYDKTTQTFSIPSGGEHVYSSAGRFYSITPLYESSVLTGYILAGGLSTDLYILRVDETTFAKIWSNKISNSGNTLSEFVTDHVNNIISYTGTFSHSRNTSHDNGCTHTSSEEKVEDIIQLANEDVIISGLLNYDQTPNYSSSCFDSPAPDWWEEGDGFAAKINFTSGRLSWFTDLDHYAGEDFLTRMRKDGSDNIYIAGTVSNPTTILGHPTAANMLVTKLSSTGSIATGWPKDFDAPTTGGSSCGFDLELDDNDKSIIEAGNNRDNEDDYIFVKLSACQSTYAFTTPATVAFGTTTNISAAHSYYKGTWDVYGTLNISSASTIEFADDAQMNDYDAGSPLVTKIVVHPGGLLNITGGSTLKAYQGCLPGMWNGIEIQGNSSLSQTTTNQGKIILDGSTIQDARTGIYATDGGIVVTQNAAIIKDCRVGVSIGAYSAPGSVDNICTFSGTTFDCNHSLPYYNGEGVDAHVKLDQVTGIKFTRCKFKNTGYSGGYPCSKWGTGIDATSSGIVIPDLFTDAFNSGSGCYDPQINGSSYSQTVDATVFENLDYGIKEINPTHSSRTVEIRLCQFSNVKQGITLEKVDGAKVMLNYFYYNNNLPALAGLGCSPLSTFYAILLDNSDAFQVQDNKITTASSGITNMYNLNGLWIKETGTLTSKVYWNQFFNNTPSNGSSNGFNLYGLVIEDAVDLGFAKDIAVWNNEFLNNYYCFKLTDAEFGAAAPSNLFVTNTFTTPVSLKIFSTNSFQYRNSGAPITSGVSTPFVIVTNGGGTTYSTGTTHNYCKGVPSVFPTTPQFITQGNATGPLAGEFNLTVFPNPTTGIVRVNYSLPEGEEKATLELTNSLGQRIEKIELSDGRGNRQMNFSHLKPGIYSYTLICGRQRKTTRLVIIK